MFQLCIVSAIVFSIKTSIILVSFLFLSSYLTGFFLAHLLEESELFASLGLCRLYRWSLTF
jgi:hypothetical protein